MAIVSITLKGGEKAAVDSDDWTEFYPDLDIEVQLLAMAAWCLANPSRRKTKRGLNRFVNLWLQRVQNEINLRANRQGAAARSSDLYAYLEAKAR